ncbi:MAG: protease PrsW [Actinomycetota bacterium]|nr:protease PrsW [Actinomycetota bacterium]
MTLDSLYVTFAVIQTVLLILAIRLADPYEHESLSLIGLMAVWGAAGAALIAWDWNLRAKDALPNDLAAVLGNAITTPLVEETAKGVALVLVFVAAYFLHRRFGLRALSGATDGLVFGAAVGLGFAFTEDVQYGLTNGIHELYLRRDFFGYGALHHALFTAAFGVGLGLAFSTRRWIMRILWPFIGLLVSMTLHSMNNGLQNFLLVKRFGLDDVAKWLDKPNAPPTFIDAKTRAANIASVVDFLVFVAAAVGLWLWLAKQRRVITEELTTEASSGLVSRRDIELTPRYWRRQRRRLQLVRAGQLQRAHAEELLYIRLARLAFAARRAVRSPGAAAEVALAEPREAVRRAKAEVRFARLVESGQARDQT